VAVAVTGAGLETTTGYGGAAAFGCLNPHACAHTNESPPERKSHSLSATRGGLVAARLQDEASRENTPGKDVQPPIVMDEARRKFESGTRTPKPPSRGMSAERLCDRVTESFILIIKRRDG